MAASSRGTFGGAAENDDQSIAAVEIFWKFAGDLLTSFCAPDNCSTVETINPYIFANEPRQGSRLPVGEAL